nr:DNA methyltransferase [Aphanizomenon flos-aquae]
MDLIIYYCSETTMTSSTPETLSKFVQFCHQHITGQERKEAQTFLDRFFRAFGHEGALEAGATYEEAIKKSSKTGKTGFADLVWKPRVLIEMKKRGEDLNKHYSQAFDYWTRLVPNRPKYVILCNFDEFWIFDFDIQLDTPVDKITLEQLPERSGALTFMELGQKTPVFQNNQVEVTVKAARRMGELLLELENRGIEKLTAQRFILQCVLAMFAEDRQLLPRDMFVSCVQDCMKGGTSYDVLGGLFREMNQPGKTPAGRYQGVDYFNGGLFSRIDAIELTREELNFLDVSARENWSKVRPAIFGNLFEGSIYKEERHARGIHYTSEVDIMKIVRPTISRYWEERIEEATTIKELSKLQIELQSYRVLDPACGSGNFLYIAYQELKRIEILLLEKIQSLRKSPDKQLQMGLVTPLQFYGMDTNPFAVELARVTLMIARKIAIDNLQLTEPALPLDTLDKNIVCEDALFSEWVKANAIIGNPPFLGGKKLRIELGDEYAEKLYKAFPDVKGQPDFCVFWFRKAADLLDNKGRAGLVGTNSIAQVSGRKASLDYIVSKGGIIHDAISTQTWSGDAAVHVSIVNWTKEEQGVADFRYNLYLLAIAKLLHNQYFRLLAFYFHTLIQQRQKQKQRFLDSVEVPFITSSLKSETSVTNAVKLQANKKFLF